MIGTPPSQLVRPLVMVAKSLTQTDDRRKGLFGLVVSKVLVRLLVRQDMMAAACRRSYSSSSGPVNWGRKEGKEE